VLVALAAVGALAVSLLPGGGSLAKDQQRSAALEGGL